MKRVYAKVEDGVVVQCSAYIPGNQPSHFIDITDMEGIGVEATYDGTTFTPRVSTPIPLDEERKSMVCSRLQGRLVLGQTTCNKLDAIAANPSTPWAMGQTILYAQQWERTSQSMDELAYTLQFTHTEMDDLFRQAMTLSV